MAEEENKHESYLGTLPNTWGDENKHYIHSTINGFNDDYIHYVTNNKLEDKLQNTLNIIYNNNNARVQQMYQETAEVKKKYFNLGPNDSISDSEFVKFLKEKLLDVMREIKQIITFDGNSKLVQKWFKKYAIPDNNGGYKKGNNGKPSLKEETKVQAYKEYGDLINKKYTEIGNSMNQMIESLGIKDDNKNFDIVSSLKKRIEDINTAVAGGKSNIGKLQFLTGNAFEPFFATVFLGYLNKSLKTADNKQYSEAITKALITGKTERVTDLIVGIKNAPSARFSLKANVKNNLDIKKQWNWEDFIADTPSLKNTNKEFNYIYDNFVALRSFNSSMISTSYKHKSKQIKNEEKILLLSNNSFTKIFNLYERVIYATLIQYGLYANKYDMGVKAYSTNFKYDMFPQFLGNIFNIVEMWKIYKDVNENLYNGTIDRNEFPLLFSEQLKTGNYGAKETYLKRLYKEKQKLMRQNEQETTLYGGKLPEKETMNLIPSSTQNIWNKAIGKKSKTLRVKLNLNKYTY